MEPISESGMLFGEYRDDQVFQIEKSTQYIERLRPHGIKACEFILRRGGKLYFIEAKKSCPRQIDAGSSEEKRKKYNQYVNDIVVKMQHSLILYSNILLKRYPADGVPESLNQKDLSGMEIRLVLVVKNAENEWLIPFQEVLARMLQHELRIWKIPGFSVINEDMARKERFVI